MRSKIRDTVRAGCSSVVRRDWLAVSLPVALTTQWNVQPAFNLQAMDRAIYLGDVRLVMNAAPYLTRADERTTGTRRCCPDPRRRRQNSEPGGAAAASRYIAVRARP